MAQTTDAVTHTFSTLADPIRRCVLYYLAEQENPVSFDQLVSQVAASCTGSRPDAVDDETIAEMRVSLYHRHLPKLADLGVISYDDNLGEITLTEDADSIVSILNSARESDCEIEPPSLQF